MSQESAFLMTLLLECCVSLIFKCSKWGKVIPLRLLLLATLCASCLTHPFAWSLNEYLKPILSGWGSVAVIEVCVIGAEGLIYRSLLSLPMVHSLILSFFSNLISFWCGLWPSWAP